MQPFPRFGGWNPLKVAAVFVAVVAGGAMAVAIGAFLMVVFSMIGIVTSGAGFLLTFGWIIAAYLIYRAIRRSQSREHYAYEYDDDDRREREREREYQRRLERLQQCAPAQAQAHRPNTRPEQKPQRQTGTTVIAVLSGLALALAANVGLSGLRLPPLAATILPPLTGAVAGLGVHAALKRWVMPPIDSETPPAGEVRAQVGRIRRKARDLQREATEAGGVFGSLDTKAELLSREAQELSDRLFDLRRVARDARREFRNPARPRGVPQQDAPAPEVQSALRQAQQAQKRLDDLLSRNRAAQHQCLAQLERIEDLLDMARLEIACPDESMPIDRGREELVQEVETELEAARRALEEVQRQSQTV